MKSYERITKILNYDYQETKALQETDMVMHIFLSCSILLHSVSSVTQSLSDIMSINCLIAINSRWHEN